MPGSANIDFSQSEINTFANETRQLNATSLMSEDYEKTPGFNYGNNHNMSSTKNTTSCLLSNQFAMIGYIIVPTFLIIGLFGNTMTIIVMRNSLFRRTSIAMILVALSLSDSTLLVMVPFNKLFLQKYLGLDVRALHWLGCKTFFWFWRTAKMTSSWFIVLISLERFVVIMHPLRAKTLVTKRAASYGILLVYLFIGGYNFIWVCFSDVIRAGKCLSNVPDKAANVLFVRAFIIGGSSLYTHIPVVLTALLNVVSVTKLVRQDRKRKSMTPHMKTLHYKRQDKSNALSAMLISVSVAFFVLVTPISVLHALTVYRGVNLFHTTDYNLSIVRELAMITEQLNYSINFYLYVLCSRAFRKQFLSIMNRMCSCENYPRLSISIVKRSREKSEDPTTSATSSENNKDETRVG